MHYDKMNFFSCQFFFIIIQDERRSDFLEKSCQAFSLIFEFFFLLSLTLSLDILLPISEYFPFADNGCTTTFAFQFFSNIFKCILCQTFIIRILINWKSDADKYFLKNEKINNIALHFKIFFFSLWQILLHFYVFRTRWHVIWYCIRNIGENKR